MYIYERDSKCKIYVVLFGFCRGFAPRPLPGLRPSTPLAGTLSDVNLLRVHRSEWLLYSEIGIVGCYLIVESTLIGR